MTGGTVVWLTGLSGSGKTTIANALRDRLTKTHLDVVVLDGDELRRTVSNDLGFTNADRDEHVRRVGALAEREARRGKIVIVALISPYRAARAAARENIERFARFIEVHVDAPIDVLRARDPKGLYRKADAGELQRFTGVSDPYEPPLKPDVRIDTSESPVDAGVDAIIKFLC